MKISLTEKITAVCLVLVMLLGMQGMTAFAADAVPLTSGKTVTDNFNSMRDSRRYSFTLSGSGYADINVSHTAAGDSTDFAAAKVTDSSGNEYSAFSLKMNAASAACPRLGLPAGEYFIDLTCTSYDEQNRSFSLKADFAAASGRETELNDTSSAADIIKLSDGVTGSLSSPADIDWYVCDSADSAALTTDAGGVWEISVYDAQLKQIAHDTCSGGSADVRFAGGKVYIMIAPVVYSGADYKLTSSHDAQVQRISGANRIDTALEISRSGFEHADSVLIANAYNFADALAGGPLAYALDAPILLTGNFSAAEYNLISEIQRLGAKNIYILGGPVAINDDIAKQLGQYGTVTRVSGASRYETAVEVAKKLRDVSGKAPAQMFFTNAMNYPDALSVGPAAALTGSPILYISPTAEIDSTTASFADSCKSAKAVVIGGNVAVSDKGYNSIKGHVSGVSRVFGDNRYDTAKAVYTAYKGCFASGAMALSTGRSFPDALAGGVFSAKKQIPLLLADDGSTGAAAAAADALGIDTVYVFGGTSAVSEKTVEAVIK